MNEELHVTMFGLTRERKVLFFEAGGKNESDSSLLENKIFLEYRNLEGPGIQFFDGPKNSTEVYNEFTNIAKFRELPYYKISIEIKNGSSNFE